MEPLRRTVTQAAIDAFGEVLGANNPVHHDRAFAIAKGFPDCIAHGLMLHALVAELLGSRFGRDALLGANLVTHFVAPACVGDVLTVDARDVSAMNDGVVLDVWCENQRGDRILTGEARLNSRGRPAPAE